MGVDCAGANRPGFPEAAIADLPLHGRLDGLHDGRRGVGIDAGGQSSGASDGSPACRSRAKSGLVPDKMMRLEVLRPTAAVEV